MDNKQNDLENDLLEIFINDHVDPSKKWLNLPLKEVIKQFEDFKQKRTQSSISEKDQQRKANIVDGLCINALLTLVHGKHFLEKNEFLESTNAVETVVEQLSRESTQFSSSLESPAKACYPLNLNKLSSWQETYLIHLADLYPSSLDFKNSLENGPKKCLTPSFRAIGEWQCRHIKWQAAAQVLWFDINANAKEICKKLLSSEELMDLLDLWVLPNIDKSPNEGEVEFRNLENAIRIVNPRGVQKGRPKKKEIVCQHPVFIPLVYDVTLEEVNWKGFLIAVEVMIKILKIQKMSSQEIMNHPLIHQYKSLDPVFEVITKMLISSAFKNREK